MRNPRWRRAGRMAALLTVTATVLSMLAAAPAIAAAPPPVTDPAALVNPFAGTGVGSATLNKVMGNGWGNGNTFPGATLPFGMLQWNPDPDSHPPGGYAYADSRITGFSLTHDSGAGCSLYGDVPFIPYPGSPPDSPAADPSRYVMGFSHADEHATPGSYSVRLANGVAVDLAAALRGGAGRFTFPATDQSTLLLNAGGSANGVVDSHVDITGSDTVTGWVTSGHFCGAPGTYTLHFAVRFDRPFSQFGTWSGTALNPGSRTASGSKAGSYLTFDTRANHQVQARVGISFVDDAGALTNLRDDVGSRGYQAVAAAAHTAWNSELRHITVHSAQNGDAGTFYTALYHAMLAPNVFSDADGRYLGFDGQVHTEPPGHAQYANFSEWDTYRTETQLLALLDPVRTSDMMQSLVNDAAQSGWLPRIPFANRHTDVMVGDPSDPILASAYAFGARGFDARAALAAMIKGATTTGTGPDGYVEREGLNGYLQHGYVPEASINVAGGAAITLEYATADFAIAQLASALQDPSTAATFMGRAQNWQQLFDPTTRYLAPRLTDGTLLPENDPSRMTGWVEGSQAQYAFNVPYNLHALITAMGGPQTANARLDQEFTKLNEGARSRYAFLGNEPGFNTPWVYDATGAPWRTQMLVRRIERELFSDQPGGLPGNDDLGAMSAWYVWSALGLYPEITGRAELAVNTPLFPDVTITRSTGQQIEIRAPGAPGAGYITGLSLDGQTIDRTYLDGAALAQHGGTVGFTLATTPDRDWGAAPADALPSFGQGQAPVTGALAPAAVAPGGRADAVLRLTGMGQQATVVHWRLGPATGITLSPSSGTVTVPASGDATVPITVTATAGQPTGAVKVPLTLRTAGGSTLPAPTGRVTVAPPGSILPYANDPGISDDKQPQQADFNDYGGSYSAQQLAAAGLAPGASVTVDGVRFTWPDARPGELDNVVAHGQRIPIAGAKPGAHTLGLLGAALGGNGSGTAVITYTDGTTQPVTLALSDWTLQGGSISPASGNKVVAVMPYRNYPTGPDPSKPYIFFTSAPLDPARTVASVTLPSDTVAQDLHIFALGAG